MLRLTRAFRSLSRADQRLLVVGLTSTALLILPLYGGSPLVMGWDHWWLDVMEWLTDL